MNDEFFQALSNPYRREIIKLLRWENMSVGDIVKRFDIASTNNISTFKMY